MILGDASGLLLDHVQQAEELLVPGVLVEGIAQGIHRDLQVAAVHVGDGALADEGLRFLAAGRLGDERGHRGEARDHGLDLLVAGRGVLGLVEFLGGKREVAFLEGLHALLDEGLHLAGRVVAARLAEAKRHREAGAGAEVVDALSDIQGEVLEIEAEAEVLFLNGGYAEKLRSGKRTSARPSTRRAETPGSSEPLRTLSASRAKVSRSLKSRRELPTLIVTGYVSCVSPVVCAKTFCAPSPRRYEAPIVFITPRSKAFVLSEEPPSCRGQISLMLMPKRDGLGDVLAPRTAQWTSGCR